MSFCVQNLSYAYKNKQILNDVNFSLARGSLNVLFGANGSGKSTLFRAILSAKQGVHFAGAPARARDIAYVPQREAIGFDFSLFEVVLMGARLRFFGALGIDAASRAAAAEALEALGILALAGAKFRELSGGYQQLGLIARALAARSSVLLLDEPTSALDLPRRHQIWRLLAQLAAGGKTLLVCTHEPELACAHAHTLLGLHEGRLRQLPNDLRGVFCGGADGAGGVGGESAASTPTGEAEIGDSPAAALVAECLGLEGFALQPSYAFLPAR